MKNINNDSRTSLEELTEIAERTRDITHNLDLRDQESQKIFDEYSRRLFIALEGYYTSAYDDGRRIDPINDSNLVKNILAAGEKIKGNITVGIGFNMDVVLKWGGQEEWEKALQGVSFDDVYNGTIDLNITEVEELFVKSKNVRLKKLKKDYGDAWNKLRPNEQLGILLPSFNGPGTVKKGTNFHGNMTAYANTRDTKYLHEAIKELTTNSNKDESVGLQKRRIVEAMVLNSTLSPFYVAGTDHQFPKDLKVVYAANTRIPRGMPIFNPKKFDEFFIWRTCLDSKVRPEHWKKEGLIYRKDNIAEEDMPGGKHNCRCWAEPVPDVECIIENKSIDALRILGLRIKFLELGLIFAQRGMHIHKQMLCNIMWEFKSLLK